MLSEISPAIISKRGGSDWNEVWKRSPQAVDLAKFISSPAFIPRNILPIFRNINDFPTFYRQAYHLFMRSARAYWRDPAFNTTRMIFSLAVGLLLGLTFLQLGHSQNDLAYRLSAIFMSG